MDSTTLLYKKESNIAVIKLNRPKSLNALNRILLRELDTLLDTIEADDEIRAVIITGNEKAFAAGADITELNDIITPTQALLFVERGQNVFNKIEGLKKPVIAAVSGFAFGGGCELALCCDLRIADESASFALHFYFPLRTSKKASRLFLKSENLNSLTNNLMTRSIIIQRGDSGTRKK